MHFLFTGLETYVEGFFWRIDLFYRMMSRLWSIAYFLTINMHSHLMSKSWGENYCWSLRWRLQMFINPVSRTSWISKPTAELMKFKEAAYQRVSAAVLLVKTAPKLTKYPSLHPVHTQNMVNFWWESMLLLFQSIFRKHEAVFNIKSASLLLFYISRIWGGGEGGSRWMFWYFCSVLVYPSLGRLIFFLHVIFFVFLLTGGVHEFFLLQVCLRDIFV